MEDRQYRDTIHALEGKTLVCHCSPKDCHGDTIAKYLNREFRYGED